MPEAAGQAPAGNAREGQESDGVSGPFLIIPYVAMMN